MKIFPDPRLPIPPSDPYLQQLNNSLYERLRTIAHELNRMQDWTLPNYTTTEKGALSPQTGMMVFDTTLGKISVYTGSAWETVTSS